MDSNNFIFKTFNWIRKKVIISGVSETRMELFWNFKDWIIRWEKGYILTMQT